MSAKVAAIPSSSGSVLRAKGCSLRASTKGTTGRMQGLRMVRAPPAKARTARIMAAPLAWIRPCRQGFCCSGCRAGAAANALAPRLAAQAEERGGPPRARVAVHQHAAVGEAEVPQVARRVAVGGDPESGIPGAQLLQG